MKKILTAVIVLAFAEMLQAQEQMAPYQVQNLTSAAATGDLTQVQTLLQAGSNIDEREQPSRIYAQVSKDGRSIVAYFPDGKPITIKSQIGEIVISPPTDARLIPIGNRTALMLAASGGHLEVVKALVAAGATIDAKDAFDQTALMHAAKSGQNKVVAFLLKSGANATAQSLFGKTAGDLATEAGKADTAALLSATPPK